MACSENFVYPDYTNSIVNIPSSILSHFGLKHKRTKLRSPLLNDIKGSNKIVLFLLDGFGYNLFEKNKHKIKLLDKINKMKIVEKITSTFPSTTAAALTSINSGLTPLEHGLLEWNLYFQELDLILETLPYKVVKTEFQMEQYIKEEPSMLFNGITIFEQLAKINIPSFYFSPRVHCDSVYTKAISKGAKIIAYDDASDLFALLKKFINTPSKKAYYFVYWPAIDDAEHNHAPYSKETDKEVNFVFNLLEKELFNNLNRSAFSKTAIFITSDHGQVAVNPENTIYLNSFSEIASCFKKSSSGRPILPTGGARDVFLSVKEEKIDHTVSVLSKKLKNSADVIKMNATEINHLFGDGIKHPEFDSRLGNVLILPKGNNTVWYKYQPDKKFSLFGHHGGLSSGEMHVPLIILKLT